MFQMPSMTRKQFWRRQSKSVKRAEHDFLYREGVEDGYGGGPMRVTVSEPSIGTTLLHVTGLGHVWATTGNLDEAHSNGNSSSSSPGMTSACLVKIKRRVNFLPTVRVVLIPSRMEYKDADMAPSLWWEDVDYSAFKKSAIRELKALMAIQHLSSTKQALQILYQPGFQLELDLETLVIPPPIVVVSTSPGNKALNSTTISQEEGDDRCVSPPAPCLEDDYEQDQRSTIPTKVLPKSKSAPELMHVNTKTKIVTPPRPTKFGSFSSIDTSTNTIISVETTTTTTEPDSFGILQARTDVDLTNHVHPGIWSSTSPHKTSSTSSTTTTTIQPPPPLHPLAFLAE